MYWLLVFLFKEYDIFYINVVLFKMFYVEYFDILREVIYLLLDMLY